EGFRIIFSSFKKSNFKYVFLILIVLATIYTAAVPKYSVQTSMWGPGSGWTSMQEVASFSKLKSLPDKTSIFLYTSRDDNYITGFDKYTCTWCSSVLDFRKNILDYDKDELYLFLKE